MKFNITSAQINSLSEIAADTDEPIQIVTKKDGKLRVKIGKGKRAIEWLVLVNGHSLPVSPKLKKKPKLPLFDSGKPELANEIQETALKPVEPQSLKA